MAQIFDEIDGVYIVSAEVFGIVIDMWIKSYGGKVLVI